MSALPLTVVILTLDEAIHMNRVVGNVHGWAKDVFVLDSGSTDETVALAEAAGARVFHNTFVNYAVQREYALRELPIQTEWMLFLDADEFLPDELKDEIAETVARNPVENGFFIRFRTIWLGKWIRHGYYGAQILRLFRHEKARCEDRSVNEHLIVEGETGLLQNDFINEDLKGVSAWIDKHNRYATFEAEEILKRQDSDRYLEVRFFGKQAQRKRWIIHHIWNRLPLLFRPFLFFFYRYFLKGGFLDGRVGFTYHVLQGFWFWFLVGVKVLEKKR